MRLSVFGLGYVGTVSAACFAKEGHQVVGVDPQEAKIKLINEGASPIVEPGLNELIEGVVTAGRLRAVTNAHEAVQASDVSLVCVGTPSNSNGSLDLSYVKRVCGEIGAAIKLKPTPHTVVVRSTMLPGTIHSVVMPVLENASGLQCGSDFFVCINPEFLREGTALRDFYNPPFSLIGADDDASVALISELYSGIAAEIFVTSVREAEMVKYSCNAFHALKVSFANEIGNVCKQLGIDSHEVMRVFCQDKKLNLSEYYLKPGFAFGGSCLPKDVRALNFKARELNLSLPVLSAILPSNQNQLNIAVQMVLKWGRKRIGVLGLSFKDGTDDLREAPMVHLIEALIGKGLSVTIYDREVSLARLHGSNKDYIETEIPHISQLMLSSIDDVIERSEVVVIGKADPTFLEAGSAMTGRAIIDLVRLFDHRPAGPSYEGLCW